MTRWTRRAAIGAAMLAALGSIVPALAVSAGPAPPRTSRCTVQGPRWSIYDAHGGPHPRLVSSGTRYSVVATNVPCATATAWVRRIFPRFPRPPFRPAVLAGGPRRFVCRSGGGGPPDRLFGGACFATDGSAADPRMFQWSPGP
jgi:hypothetical protein